MRFIADVMLGRLAKWLRIIGCDVAYDRRMGDRELVNLALKDNRMILTRDTLLIRRKKARGNFFLVIGNSYKDQLKQVAMHFSLEPYNDLFTRCIECNALLTAVDKEKVRDALPEYVVRSQNSFRQCPECRKVYWSATHKDGVMKILAEIFRE